jgi:hypothetical protein
MTVGDESLYKRVTDLSKKREVHKLLISYLEFKKFHVSFSCMQEVHGYQQRCVPPVGPMTVNHGRGGYI